ncbi:hypothetical protein ATY78_24750 [Rhizobium sp. R635]|nr:hypothetical protein ATY78_24750 [Rhizobium sp. R635]
MLAFEILIPSKWEHNKNISGGGGMGRMAASLSAHQRPLRGLDFTSGRTSPLETEEGGGRCKMRSARNFVTSEETLPFLWRLVAYRLALLINQKPLEVFMAIGGVKCSVELLGNCVGAGPH